MFKSCFRLSIVFNYNTVTHGEMDPQRSLGPLEDLNANSPVTVMSRETFLSLSLIFANQISQNLVQSSGRDFGSPSETDYVVLQQTKEQARELIIQWILDAAIEEPTEPPTVNPDDTTTAGPIPAKRFSSLGSSL